MLLAHYFAIIANNLVFYLVIGNNHFMREKMSTKIYHNPRCSKSRQTLQLLEDNQIQPEIVEYLKTPPSKNELQDILHALNMTPRELMRKGEAEYKENNLADETLSDEQLIEAMIKYPKLIERPIVVTIDATSAEKKYALGRPPESVLDIL
jgi:arsenate reductase (glutaredoxin)